MLRVSEIEPRPDQPRKNFESEAIASLADSIAENGVLQPLLVRSGEDGFYQIIAGERRWRAARMAISSSDTCTQCAAMHGPSNAPSDS